MVAFGVYRWTGRNTYVTVSPAAWLATVSAAPDLVQRAPAGAMTPIEQEIVHLGEDLRNAGQYLLARLD
jgi:hypothetical protein